MPVAATPAPMMIVPWASSQTRSAHETAVVAAHDRLAVATAGAHREGQQEGRQEERDRQR